jgi:hypothetical protein
MPLALVPASTLLLLLRTPHHSPAFIFHDLLYLESKGISQKALDDPEG